MPFDAAFAEDDGMVLAWIVAHGENGGGSFDWDSMRWRDK
jgi:hypothetical protein